MILDNNGHPIQSQPPTIKVLSEEGFQRAFEILDFHHEVLEQMANGTPIQDIIVFCSWLLGLIEAQDPSQKEFMDVLKNSFRDYGAAYMEKHNMLKDPQKGQFTLFFPVLFKENLTPKEN